MAEADRNQLLVFLIEMAYVEVSDQLRALHKSDLATDGARHRAVSGAQTQGRLN